MNFIDSKEIENISSARFNNVAHQSFVKNVVELAKEDSKIAEKCKELVDDLAEKEKVEDENLKVSTKSSFTEEIVTADKDQDSLYLVFKQTVQGFVSVSIPEFSKAAKAISEHIATYKIDTGMQIDTETGLMMNFIQDLEGKYKENVSVLNLSPLVTQMKEANDKVRSLLKARGDEKAGKVVGALKQARSETDISYKRLVKYVNAYALIEGDAEYAHFIDRLNIEIKRFKEQVM